MSTLGGLFQTKPRCKRNFLLENIRDVRKERTKKSQSGNPQMAKPVLNKHRVPQPLGKFTQSKGSSSTAIPSQTNQVSRSKNPAQEGLHRQKKGGTKYHTDNGSQTTCELHTLCRQRDDGNITTCSGRDASSGCNYIDEENVPFRWAQVCPSVISHTLCHQSVQTLNEDDLDSLLEDGCIKYPTSDKIAENGREKDSPHLEWPTYADEDVSVPSGSLASHRKSISPVQFNTASSAAPNGNANGQPGEKKRPSESASEKYSVAIRRNQSPPPRRSRQPLSSKTNTEGINTLQDIGNKYIQDVRTDETESVKRLPRIKGRSAGQLKSNLDERAEIVEVSSLGSNEFPSRPPTGYQKGVIPKYLAKRISEQKALSKTTESNDISLEEERRIALRKASQDFNDLVAELNKMPVRTDTLRTKTRKIEIEKELNLLERRIRDLTKISDL